MGFLLTLLGAFLAALKTVITNRIQTGRLKLTPLELLYRMSPLALVQSLIYAYLTDELSIIYKIINGEAETLEGMASFAKFEPSGSLVVKLILNGIIAFGLNVVSFTANKNKGALTMTVAANVKQVITIIIAIVLFNLSINFTNGLGIVLTLIGGAWYAKLELDRMQKNVSPAGAAASSRITNLESRERK
ncbi:hypothetical protein D0Z00_001571 [Geotrichum galactomycetum]|uniref:Uncharacterized protein n=1 Tax=Geotrichum galactomycetum TaxID=27317 RepID=A0ACB6V6N1_9ASCO|nr:hypothetical protein D0Z00_001571 [Geotrichum candidum]